MEIHIIATPSARTSGAALSALLQPQWPNASVRELPAGITRYASTYHPPDLAVIAHGDVIAVTSDDLVAIRQRSGCPIVISAPGIDELFEIEWLQLGADVVIGSMSPAKLVAVLDALLRRTAGARLTLHRTQTVGDLTFNVDHRTIAVRDTQMAVTPTEFRLLEALAAHIGNCVSSPELMRTVWGLENEAVRKSLKVHMSRLRSKLGDAGSSFTINGMRGNGYILRDRSHASMTYEAVPQTGA